MAADIALSPGRVAYDDDQTAAVTTWTRVVGGTPTAVTAGAADLARASRRGRQHRCRRRAHLCRSPVPTPHPPAWPTRLTIRSPIRTATLATKSVAEDVELSGNRVVFDTGAGPKPMLYDLRTGVLTTITGAIVPACGATTSPSPRPTARSGASSSAVTTRRSSCGDRCRPSSVSVFVQVFSFGDYVAWQLEAAIAAPPFQVAHDGYRDARTMAAAHSIPDTYFPRAATSDGLLEQHYAGNQVTYYLQHYGSTQRARCSRPRRPGCWPAARPGRDRRRPDRLDRRREPRPDRPAAGRREPRPAALPRRRAGADHRQGIRPGQDTLAGVHPAVRGADLVHGDDLRRLARRCAR